MVRSLWRDWWWVVSLCLAATSVYLHFIQGKSRQIEELTTRYDEMQREKLAALQERENLRLQIESHGDPSWIELILMRDLGVVPEGWLKVYFTK
jgi:hypothetical protein